MDTGERVGYDRHATQVARLECGVFARRAFAVVVLTDDDPANVRTLVIFGDFRDGEDSWGWGGGEIPSVTTVGCAREEGVFGTDEEVVGDIFEMAAVIIPGAGRGDMVGCAFAFKEEESVSLKSVRWSGITPYL